MSEQTGKYSAMQETFVDKFIEECLAGTDATLAANIAKETAGYVSAYPVAKILAVVNDEIVKRCQYIMTMNTVLATKEVIGVLKDPTKDGSRRILEAATFISDRAGLTKKEQIEVDIKTENGVLIIPPKKPNI